MTTATTIADYDIRYVPVSADNEGEPCQRCQEIDAVITCTVHGVCDGEVVAPDCCAACFRTVVEEMDPLCRVTVHCNPDWRTLTDCDGAL